MEAIPGGVLLRAITRLTSLLLIVCVTTACGDMNPAAGNGGGNPLTPTPVTANAGFSARSVHLPRIMKRMGRSTSRFGFSSGGVTKKTLDPNQAADLAGEAIANLTDTVVEALMNCPLTFSGQILCPVDTTDSCAIGGRVEVHGNWSGSIDSAGVGQLLLDSSETLTDCQSDNGVVVNGDPALTLTATVNTDGSGTVQIGGGITWVEQDGSAGSCQVSVTSIVDATGAENDSGTVCGIDVNAL
jgi:hypothetical protein